MSVKQKITHALLKVAQVLAGVLVIYGILAALFWYKMNDPGPSAEEMAERRAEEHAKTSARPDCGPRETWTNRMGVLVDVCVAEMLLKGDTESKVTATVFCTKGLEEQLPCTPEGLHAERERERLKQEEMQRRKAEMEATAATSKAEFEAEWAASGQDALLKCWGDVQPGILKDKPEDLTDATEATCKKRLVGRFPGLFE